MASRNRYDMDEILESPFDFDQFKRILGYTNPYRKRLVATLVVTIAASALSLLNPIIMMLALNEAIPQGNVTYLVILASIFTVMIIAGAIAASWRMRAITYIGQDIIHDIRLDMYKHLQFLPFDYFDSRPHGKILTRVVNYVNTVSDLLSNVLVSSIVEIFSLIIILVYMMIVDVQLTLYAVAGLPFLFLGIMLLKKSQRAAQQYFNMKSSNLNAYSQESVQGMKITQLFAREQVNREIYHGLGAQFRESWLKTTFLQFLLTPLVVTISNATIAVLFAGSALWIRNANGDPLPVGTIIAFVSYMGYFWQPITNLANYYNQLLNGASYIERIIEFLDEPLVIEDEADAYDLPPVQGKVSFENVTFSYDTSKIILKDLSFQVEAGETIALVGPTGAGKSTVVNLISRFYDLDSGSIKLDGHDIREVTLDSLRQQMGIMLQDPFLFPDTIMENIRYGRLDASDEECIAAAKAVHAHEFIMRQPRGYETAIQEQGTGVSAGERQLISFARVLLSNPALLILDEATSSIDTKTEKALQQGMDELLKGRTSFVIAHRLSTIREADQIFYIANQGIAEAGTHNELMLQRGFYASLYKHQIEEMKLANS